MMHGTTNINKGITSFVSAGQLLTKSEAFAVLGYKSATLCVLLPTFWGLFYVPVVKTQSVQEELSRNGRYASINLRLIT